MKWDTFMFYRLYLLYDHPARMSGQIGFTITKKIATPSIWVLKVYADLKTLYLRVSIIQIPIFTDTGAHRNSDNNLG